MHDATVSMPMAVTMCWLAPCRGQKPKCRRPFLSEFKDRGLYGMERIVSEEALPEGFTVFSLPPSHRRRLRSTPRLSAGTTHLVERLNE